MSEQREPTYDEIEASVEPIWLKVKPSREAQMIRSSLSVEFDDRKFKSRLSDFIPDYVWGLIDIAAQRGIESVRAHPPGEASEGDVALVCMAVMGVPGWRVSDRNDTNVKIADRIARAAIAALPAPAEREALKEALALLAKAGDQLEGYGIVSNTLERARGKLSALLGEEK